MLLRHRFPTSALTPRVKRRSTRGGKHKEEDHQRHQQKPAALEAGDDSVEDVAENLPRLEDVECPAYEKEQEDDRVHRKGVASPQNLEGGGKPPPHRRRLDFGLLVGAGNDDSPPLAHLPLVASRGDGPRQDPGEDH